MPKGSKYQVFIPADLAYGAKRAGQLIQSDSVLIFDLELVDIKQAPLQQPLQFPGGGIPQPGDEIDPPAVEEEATEEAPASE